MLQISQNRYNSTHISSKNKNIYTIERDHTLIIYSFAESILIFISFMLGQQRNLLYSSEGPGTAYKKLQNLTSFNNEQKDYN